AQPPDDFGQELRCRGRGGTAARAFAFGFQRKERRLARGAVRPVVAEKVPGHRTPCCKCVPSREGTTRVSRKITPSIFRARRSRVTFSRSARRVFHRKFPKLP